MPAAIGHEKEEEIFALFIQGYSLDNIAKLTGVSKGTAVNKVKQKKQSLGMSDINTIRAVAAGARKLGMSTEDCIVGIRLYQLMKMILGKSSKNPIKEGDLEECVESTLHIAIVARNRNLSLRELLYSTTTMLDIAKAKNIKPADVERIVTMHQTEIKTLKIQKEKLEKQFAQEQKIRESEMDDKIAKEPSYLVGEPLVKVGMTEDQAKTIASMAIDQAEHYRIPPREALEVIVHNAANQHDSWAEYVRFMKSQEYEQLL